MKEICFTPEATDWEEAGCYPPGAKICILRRDESGTIRSMLVKVGSHFSVGGHTNTTDEEQLVLKGEIQSSGRSYREGSYWFVPKGTSHGPWSSTAGATILVRWD